MYYQKLLFIPQARQVQRRGEMERGGRDCFWEELYTCALKAFLFRGAASQINLQDFSCWASALHLMMPEKVKEVTHSGMVGVKFRSLNNNDN